MTGLEKFFQFESGRRGRPRLHARPVRGNLGARDRRSADLHLLFAHPQRDGTFEMVVRNVGNVTEALHGLEAGARVGMRGPFGTHFPVDDAMKGRDLLFVCGGIGLVPVRSAIQYVLDHRDDYGNVTILFGTRRPADRLFVGRTCRVGSDRDDVALHETVDVADADWTGNVGVITTLIPRVAVDPASTTAIVCGPPDHVQVRAAGAAETRRAEPSRSTSRWSGT